MSETNSGTQDNPSGISRQEFLYYIWSASAALLFVEASAGIAWYFSGGMRRRSETLLEVDLKTLPPVGWATAMMNGPALLLSNTAKGLVVWQNTCPHMGCLFKISPQGTPSHEYPQFVCPCHGTAFTFDGRFIMGPAYHDPDQYRVIVTTPDEARVTPVEGGPVNIEGAVRIQIDTEAIIYGKPRGATLRL